MRPREISHETLMTAMLIGVGEFGFKLKTANLLAKLITEDNALYIKKEKEKKLTKCQALDIV